MSTNNQKVKDKKHKQTKEEHQHSHPDGKEQKHHQHKEEGTHSGHHKMMMEDFKKRFWISLILTVPVLLLSPTVQEWFNFSISFPGSDYAIFALGTILFFYGGWPFLSGFVSEMKEKSPGMMTLIALAITVAINAQFLRRQLKK